MGNTGGLRSRCLKACIAVLEIIPPPLRAQKARGAREFRKSENVQTLEARVKTRDAATMEYDASVGFR